LETKFSPHLIVIIYQNYKHEIEVFFNENDFLTQLNLLFEMFAFCLQIEYLVNWISNKSGCLFEINKKNNFIQKFIEIKNKLWNWTIEIFEINFYRNILGTTKI
jgi:hypothetical protein